MAGCATPDRYVRYWVAAVFELTPVIHVAGWSYQQAALSSGQGSEALEGDGLQLLTVRLQNSVFGGMFKPGPGSPSPTVQVRVSAQL
jgi:hypothetical protein